MKVILRSGLLHLCTNECHGVKVKEKLDCKWKKIKILYLRRKTVLTINNTL